MTRFSSPVCQRLVEVCLLSHRMMLPCASIPIRPITDRPSLSPRSFTRSPIGLPRGWLSISFLDEELRGIGIGRDLTAPPSPTTVHTAPYTAVRIVMLYSLKPGFGYSAPPSAIRSLRQQLPGLHLGSPLRSPVLTVYSAACHA